MLLREVKECEDNEGASGLLLIFKQRATSHPIRRALCSLHPRKRRLEPVFLFLGRGRLVTHLPRISCFGVPLDLATRPPRGHKGPRPIFRLPPLAYRLRPPSPAQPSPARYHTRLRLISGSVVGCDSPGKAQMRPRSPHRLPSLEDGSSPSSNPCGVVSSWDCSQPLKPRAPSLPSPLSTRYTQPCLVRSLLSRGEPAAKACGSSPLPSPVQQKSHQRPDTYIGKGLSCSERGRVIPASPLVEPYRRTLPGETFTTYPNQHYRHPLSYPSYPPLHPFSQPWPAHCLVTESFTSSPGVLLLGSGDHMLTGLCL